jgi:hypothetical protein
LRDARPTPLGISRPPAGTFLPPPAQPPQRLPLVNLTTTPPDVSGSTKVFVRLANRTGSAEVASLKSIAAGTVSVATECAGEGKLIVAVGELATYTVPCGTRPSGTYNEIALDSTRHRVDITVKVNSGTHWGLSVGWHRGVRHAP